MLQLRAGNKTQTPWRPRSIGVVSSGRPSIGSWLTYGLGTENKNLPGYVVLCPDIPTTVGPPLWSNGFLPAIYQPTFFRPGSKPVLNLDLPSGVSMGQRRKTLDLIRGLNQANMQPDDTEFAARINAYDLAFKMQVEAPAIFDLSTEPQETLDMYGVGKQPTDDYGRRCLLTRRLRGGGCQPSSWWLPRQ